MLRWTQGWRKARQAAEREFWGLPGTGHFGAVCPAQAPFSESFLTYSGGRDFLGGLALPWLC